MTLTERAVRAAHKAHAEHQEPECATSAESWRDCLTCHDIVKAVTAALMEWRYVQVRANS